VSNIDKKRGLGKGMSSLLDGFDYDVQVENVINKTVSSKKQTAAAYIIICRKQAYTIK